MPRYQIRLLTYKLRNKETWPYKFSFWFEEFDLQEEVPPYGVLSHTWSDNHHDEVMDRHIREHRADHKPGYKKLAFCATWAHKTGLNYIWVDTCCIPQQENNPEKNWAITQMFEWYKNSHTCYVYLSDIRFTFRDKDKDMKQFRQARWHTRGWTLQEMLAPEKVEFFDSTGEYLGSKQSLQKHISRVNPNLRQDCITNGHFLWTYSRYNRITWADSRTTKKPEDQAYCLAALCGVSLQPNYEEGRVRANRRLFKAIDEANEKDGRPQEFKEMSSILVDHVLFDKRVRARDKAMAAASIVVYPWIRSREDKSRRETELRRRCNSNWVDFNQDYGHLQRAWRQM